uniref:AXE1 n=1 Tax=uncultured Brachybacterium sp. TaxID=189680 RepID=A0A060CGX5_9MICO|nr:AXE1 [uncultured Brachybacterium sp.]
MWSIALFDDICPPSTTFAAYNWYGSTNGSPVRKDLAIYPYNTHEGGEWHQRRLQWDFLRTVIQ